MYEYKGYPYPPKGWRVSREKMEILDCERRLLFPTKKNGRIVKKKYLDEQEGIVVGDIWTDITQLRAQDSERLGYPTQKPLALLERIIKASSNPGDVVLDSFSGCGTAIMAAEKLKRCWIGIDITHLAIAMHKSRLWDMYELLPKRDYEVIGEPADLESSRELAQNDRYQFQWWALSLVHARPSGGGPKGKKGADHGIDGIITFLDDAGRKFKRVMVQVKSGHVKVGDVRDLRGVLDREEDAPIGVLVTLENPSQEMVKEAVSAGFYHSPLWGKDFPRIQILTIENLLKGTSWVRLPPSLAAYKEAERVKAEVDQLDLFN